jgi:plasmid stability protein
MAGPTGKLTDLRIRTAKPSGKIRKLSDGRGLQLWVSPAGGKSWRLDYRFGGKKKLLSIGPYPEISAAVARAAADEAREQLRQGLDPSEKKKEAKVAALAAVEHSFGNLAKRLVEMKRREKKADVTLAKMEWIFGKTEADLGHRSIQEISTPDIIAVLKREEEAGNLETARRMRTVTGEVFRYAMQILERYALRIAVRASGPLSYLATERKYSWPNTPNRETLFQGTTNCATTDLWSEPQLSPTPTSTTLQMSGAKI